MAAEAPNVSSGAKIREIECRTLVGGNASSVALAVSLRLHGIATRQTIAVIRKTQNARP
jgi:hypothetical protein